MLIPFERVYFDDGGLAAEGAVYDRPFRADGRARHVLGEYRMAYVVGSAERPVQVIAVTFNDGAVAYGFLADTSESELQTFVWQ